jgi:hypothetical protein
MSIRQLNANYVPEEDRVMLRFTTGSQEEYRFWLTRLVVSALLDQTQALAVKALEQQVSVHQAKAIAQFKQQTLQQTATFTQFEGATRFPLGAEPVLVRSVQAQGDGIASVFVWALPRGQQLTLNLNEDLLGKLQLLMQKMNEAAHWAIGVLAAAPAFATASVPGASPEQDELTGGAQPPKVLH